MRQAGISEHEIFDEEELTSYEMHIFGKYVDEDGNVNFIENCCGWMGVTV